MTAFQTIQSASLRGEVVTRIAQAMHSPVLSPVADVLIHKVKTCLFDFIGCAFESRDLPWSLEAVHFARLLGLRVLLQRVWILGLLARV